MSAQLDIITTAAAPVPADREPASEARSLAGLVLPPPEIRSIVDKTATFVARNGIQFEDRILDKERNNPKFCFLRPDDPYHPYYQHCIEEIRAGRELKPEGPAAGAGTAEDGTSSGGGDGGDKDAAPKARAPPPEPDAYQFSATIPTLSAQDLDIIKLTAQFVARNGRQFLNSLAQREQRNYQFDFLRPSHSLYGYFNLLVEQYAKILMPSHSLQKQIDESANDRTERVDYATYVAAEHKKAEDMAEKERIAFLSIDWHDFVVVETIEFTAADEEASLPLPLNRRDLESMTLEQRRQAAVIPTTATAAQNNEDDGMDMEDDNMVESDNEDTAAAAPVQQKRPDLSAQMKIRKDYVPKARIGAVGANRSEPTQICPRCQQAIPISEMDEHVRIELLDPRWKEQKQAAEAKNRESNLLMEGTEVNKILKNISGYRSDIFGTDEVGIGQKVMQDRERMKAAEKQKVIWDGHSASIPAVNERAAAGLSIEEQMAAIQQNKQRIEEQNRIGPHGANAYGAAAPMEAPPEEEPTSKKMRVEGKFIPAEEWLETHPASIKLTLQAVNMPEKSDGKLVGQVHVLDDVALTLTVSELRERISTHFNVPANRQKLTCPVGGPNGSVMKPQFTLAYYNLNDGDTIQVGVAVRGGRR
ncbi:Pre-mRNA splicing factor PRP21 like protein-domain-containing protein [Syncephalis pseudoplumigaleata]|uniref:Pre-mRNA splicing factor PRP21 like protein-domain-containing protein n=1 Tax=Syncephalis pseudoplumigaleata TaxID=1712513 RepID=A0A4P9Z1H4_9FUNG|nr:Pre-mRNA splicing factor PRP21 like protein-domain-containing protein [Syncephalis pseudoplumigaleata]|eukprot:RKP26188.1 Pre-mRNA splicing factor PRP21 like protein-domain-containing protein [Syncephalis pseudoplumigaleata]